MTHIPALSTAILFDTELPAKLRSTLFFLLGLSGPDHTSRPVTFVELARGLGKSRSNVYEHLVALRTYKNALTVRYVDAGTIVLIFADWLFDAETAFESESPDSVHKEEEEEVLKDLKILKPLPLLNAKSPQIQTRGLAPETEEALLAASIFRGLLDEIASYGRSDEDLLALLAWAGEDQPKRPAGLFMARLRLHATAPDEYYGQACPQCGHYGGHAGDCRKRYFIPGLMEE